MIIDKLVEDDIPPVVDLILRNYDEVMARHHTPAAIAKFRGEVTPEFVKTQMRWKHILVVRLEGQTVATGAVANFGTPVQPRYCLSQIFVRPDLHGRGIGTALVDRLLTFLREQGVSICHVPSNRNAIGFYRTFGFVPDEAQPDIHDELTWMTAPL